MTLGLPTLFFLQVLYKSIFCACFCVHYLKIYGAMDNILKTWRQFWIYSNLIN